MPLSWLSCLKHTAAASSHLEALTSRLLSYPHVYTCALQVIMVLVVFGVGAIIGDGVLTPAMSVLSSIEGLHEVAHISQGSRNYQQTALAFGLFHASVCQQNLADRGSSP